MDGSKPVFPYVRSVRTRRIDGNIRVVLSNEIDLECSTERLNSSVAVNEGVCVNDFDSIKVEIALKQSLDANKFDRRAVGLCETVSCGEFVACGLGVSVESGVNVFVRGGTGVCVFVRTGVCVSVKTGVCVSVKTGVCVFVKTGVCVFVKTGVCVPVKTGVCVFVKMRVCVLAGRDVCAGFC
jgi:hypothetical protein